MDLSTNFIISLLKVSKFIILVQICSLSLEEEEGEENVI